MAPKMVSRGLPRGAQESHKRVPRELNILPNWVQYGSKRLPEIYSHLCWPPCFTICLPMPLLHRTPVGIGFGRAGGNTRSINNVA
eukprot:12832-Pyramimonas_sp.AAC.1